MELHVLCLVVTVICGAATVQAVCPPHEMPSSCVNPCNTCDQQSYCVQVCIPGCDCIDGFTRDHDGVCVPTEDCFSEAGFGPIFEEDRNCNFERCDSSCRRRGHPGGYCISTGLYTHCRCRNRQEDQEVDEAGFGPIFEEDRNCNFERCDSSCRRSGHPGGYCISTGLYTHCRCRAKQDDQEVDEPAFVPVLDEEPFCIKFECRRNCRRQGFSGGTCVPFKFRRICKCSGRQSDEELGGPEFGDIAEPEILEEDRGGLGKLIGKGIQAIAKAIARRKKQCNRSCAVTCVNKGGGSCDAIFRCKCKK